jgi:hypothetical protein
MAISIAIASWRLRYSGREAAFHHSKNASPALNVVLKFDVPRAQRPVFIAHR